MSGGVEVRAPSDQGPLALMREHRSVDHGPMYSDHHGLERLSEEECVELLRTKTVGRIGLSASSLPFVLPVRYVVDDGRILMRTGQDTRMAAATRDAVVAFEVDAGCERASEVQAIAPAISSVDAANPALLTKGRGACVMDLISRVLLMGRCRTGHVAAPLIRLVGALCRRNTMCRARRMPGSAVSQRVRTAFWWTASG